VTFSIIKTKSINQTGKKKLFEESTDGLSVVLSFSNTHRKLLSLGYLIFLSLSYNIARMSAVAMCPFLFYFCSSPSDCADVMVSVLFVILKITPIYY